MTAVTMLQFDYDTVDGETVTAVLGQPEDDRSWRSVAIVIGSRALVLSVDNDSDQIFVDLKASPDGPEWVAVEPMKMAVGSLLGWCWIGRNYRGYLDMFTVSFSDLEPQFLFFGMASTLHLRRISEPS